MAKLGTWLRVTNTGTQLCHQGYVVAAFPGDTKVDISNLSKFYNHPNFNPPTVLVNDPDPAPKTLPVWKPAEAPKPVAASPVVSATPTGNLIITKTTYFDQRQSTYKPNSSCMPSSMAVVASAYGIDIPGSSRGEEIGWIHRRLENTYGQRIAGTVGCGKALMQKDWGLKDEVVWSLSPAKYEAHIKSGGLVILHTKARSLTNSGHVIALIGSDHTRGYKSAVSQDSWGEANRGSGGRYTKGKGRHVRYSYNWLFSSSTLLAAHLVSHPTIKPTYH